MSLGLNTWAFSSVRDGRAPGSNWPTQGSRRGPVGVSPAPQVTEREQRTCPFPRGQWVRVSSARLSTRRHQEGTVPGAALWLGVSSCPRVRVLSSWTSPPVPPPRCSAWLSTHVGHQRLGPSPADAVLERTGSFGTRARMCSPELHVLGCFCEEFCIY